jgi:hypothetical protein
MQYIVLSTLVRSKRRVGVGRVLERDVLSECVVVGQLLRRGERGGIDDGLELSALVQELAHVDDHGDHAQKDGEHEGRHPEDLASFASIAAGLGLPDVVHRSSPH